MDKIKENIFALIIVIALGIIFVPMLFNNESSESKKTNEKSNITAEKDLPAPPMANKTHQGLQTPANITALKETEVHQEDTVDQNQVVQGHTQQPAEPEQAQHEEAQSEQAAREQAQLEQAKREKAQHEQTQREQVQHEQAQLEQAKREKAQHEQTQREQAQHEQAQHEQAKREKAQHEQAQREQTQLEQAKREKAQHEQAQLEQAKREKAQNEQAQREEAQREQAQREQAQLAQSKVISKHEKVEPTQIQTPIVHNTANEPLLDQDGNPIVEKLAQHSSAVEKKELAEEDKKELAEEDKKENKVEKAKNVKAKNNKAKQAYGWLVQLGTFADPQHATVLTKKLKAAGYPAFIRHLNRGDRVLNIVLVGPRISKAQAESWNEELSSKYNLSGVVISHKASTNSRRE